jgi:hypothetical protein
MVSKFDDIPFCSNNSNAGYLYGMFEIRCKLPKKKGQYPSFWLNGNTAWPPEIDVFEFNGSNHDNFFSSVYWIDVNDNNQHCSNYYNYPFDLTDDFHTWTVVWTPSQIIWFFDGKELKTDNNLIRVPGTTSPSMWERCNWRKMNQQIGSGLNWPDSSENILDPLIVDYIKVYKPIGYVPYTTGSFDNWHNNVIIPLYNNTQIKSYQDWILNKIISTEDYNSFSDLNALQGSGKFYYKGDYNLLWNTYWYDYGSGPRYYSAPLDWNQPITGNISVSANNEIPFFKKSSQLQYYQNSQIYIVKTPLPVNNVANKILTNPDATQVLYIGNDNNIYECKRINISTHSWTRTKITNTNNVSNEFIRDPNNLNIIYYISSLNQLVKLSFEDLEWSTTIISTVNDVFSSLSISPNGDKIYYKTSNNKLVYYQKNINTWNRVQFNSISPYSNGLNVWVDNIKSSICLAENPHQIYYIGTDNRIWIIYLDNDNNWHNTAIDWKINYAKGDSQITNPTSAGKKLCFVGLDNKIRVLNWDICQITNPTCDAQQYYRKFNSSNILPKNQQEDSSSRETSIQYIKLSPNPTNEEIKLSSVDNILFSNVIFYNINGDIVKELNNVNTNQTIYINDLIGGIYFIKAISSTINYTSKFVKN